MASSGDEEDKNELGENGKQKTPKVGGKKAGNLGLPARGYESENEKSIESATTSSTLLPIGLKSRANGDQTPKNSKKNQSSTN